MPQALTGPSEVYYNMSESWDEYLVRTRNKWTIGEFAGLSTPQEDFSVQSTTKKMFSLENHGKIFKDQSNFNRNSFE